MNSLWLNIRILLWHLQIGEPRWFSIHVSKNDYHKDWHDGYFKVYQAPWLQQEDK